MRSGEARLLQPVSAYLPQAGGPASLPFLDDDRGPHGSFQGPRLFSLIICTLDEDEAITPVLAEVDALLASTPHEIIVVDDSANERTADAVLAFAARRAHIKLIHRQGDRGLASAAIAGWDAARGDVVGIMDGDGQHDPRRILDMLAVMETTEAEIVVASRPLLSGETGLSWIRNRLSRVGTALTRSVLGVRLSDPLSGFFVVRRSWYGEVRPRLSGVGFKILIDLVASGARAPRTAEVQTSLRTRVAGASKLDLRVMLELAGLLIEKRTRGLFSTRLTLFCAVGASGLAVHLLTLSAAGAARAPFWLAQGLAIVLAMTWNFGLNNALTFRDMRLRGAALLRGLGLFYVFCMAGAVLNEAVGIGVNGMGAKWFVAATAGALAGAVSNYLLASRWLWKRAEPAPVRTVAAPRGPLLSLAQAPLDGRRDV